MKTEKQIWKETIQFNNATIGQIIRNLNHNSTKISLIINESGVFEGTISDGDIRRALLKGLNLESPITNVINRNALVAPPEMGRELVKQLMVSNKINQIPVVDAYRHVVGLHLWNEIEKPNKRSNIMVIVAGGKGTRLRPQTENCPKPLLHVGGRPMLEHIIERAKLDGFTQFVISIHYLGHMIEAHFGDGARFGVHIEYLKEESPLGTAGALKLLNPIPDSPFVVTNGDVITDIRYGELLDFHVRNTAAATMAVRVHEWQNPFGVVQMRGGEIIGFEEKPITRSHINAGVYVLEPSALSVLAPEAHCDMPTLFERLREKAQRTVAYPLHEHWLDVGRPDDLQAANEI